MFVRYDKYLKISYFLKLIIQIKNSCTEIDIVKDNLTYCRNCRQIGCLHALKEENVSTKFKFNEN